jgi:hypothetical protein
MAPDHFEEAMRRKEKRKREEGQRTFPDSRKQRGHRRDIVVFARRAAGICDVPVVPREMPLFGDRLEPGASCVPDA